jgi:colicin import membrane protein
MEPVIPSPRDTATPSDGAADAALEPRPARRWFTKKRFIIPAGFLALVLAVNAGGGADPEPVATDRPVSSSKSPTAKQTTKRPTPTPTVDPSASAAAEAAKVEAERVAAEQAAAEQAAAEAEAAAKAAADKAAAEEAAANAGTVAQQNAQRSARDYLNYTAFSRTGLIGQLEYEGYSTADATWAVDRVTVDWNEQAAKSAKAYLAYTSFSRSGLIGQLLYEGFTQSQAEYGVSTTGL